MAASDSFVGDGLNPSPYKEMSLIVVEQNQEIVRLRAALQDALSVISQAFHCIDSTDNRELTHYERATADRLNDCSCAIMTALSTPRC